MSTSTQPSPIDPSNLNGKRIAITGGTGFLGTALIERLIRLAPECELVLLIRPGTKSTAAERARREIFRNDAFSKHLKSVGKDTFWEEIERRVTVIAGNVSSENLGLSDEDQHVLASCDTVVHSAATVSFDAPLDSAIEVNMLGPSRITATLQKRGASPHFIAVSTCYVAGNRRGFAGEELLTDSPFHIDISWQDEVDAARRSRSDFDAESRSAARLAKFRSEARQELGAAGIPLLSAKTEQIRQRWVKDQLIEAGKARAASLGWPDAYAYTKALGERVLDETRGDIKVSLVRPSIIESAWAEPYPGWIKGFRMAEPIIINYARGLLKEFPGIPEGIIDVIPVDIVVAAIVNVAARGPVSSAIDITQVASGTVNPLKYRKLVDLVRSWFGDKPLYDDRGQPIVVPEWSFPGRGAVERKLTNLHRNLGYVDTALKALPLRGTLAQVNTRVEEQKELAGKARDYVAIYGAYAECEALYGVENLIELHTSLTPAASELVGCDPSVIDWDTYVHQIHLPSVVKHARVKTTADRTDPDARVTRLRKRVLDPERQLAAFDLENTIIASNVVNSYFWLASKELKPTARLELAAQTVLEAPRLLALDRQDRTDFLRHFYRRYNGVAVEHIAKIAPELLSDHILTKSFPAAIARVRHHRRLGHRTVLITGALGFVVEPLRPLFDDVICAEMSKSDSRYTGELLNVPPTGEVRAQALRDYASAGGLDLKEAVAYADSSSDLPFLEIVGFPVAVNPETRLALIAKKRGWLTENWRKSAGGADKKLPMARSVIKPRSRR